MVSAKDIKTGGKYRVRDVRIIGDAYKRIADMGLTAGADIELVGKAPFGNPLLFKVRDFYMAIRAEDAAEIFVSPTNSAVKL